LLNILDAVAKRGAGFKSLKHAWAGHESASPELRVIHPDDDPSLVRSGHRETRCSSVPRLSAALVLTVGLSDHRRLFVFIFAVIVFVIVGIIIRIARGWSEAGLRHDPRGCCRNETEHHFRLLPLYASKLPTGRAFPMAVPARPAAEV
jgi:hypothetical protein